MAVGDFDKQMQKQGWEAKLPLMFYTKGDDGDFYLALPGKLCLKYRDFYDKNNSTEEIDVEEHFTVKEFNGLNWEIDIVLELLNHSRYLKNEKQFNFYKSFAVRNLGLEEEDCGTF